MGWDPARWGGSGALPVPSLALARQVIGHRRTPSRQFVKRGHRISRTRHSPLLGMVDEQLPHRRDRPPAGALAEQLEHPARLGSGACFGVEASTTAARVAAALVELGGGQVGVYCRHIVPTFAISAIADAQMMIVRLDGFF